MESHENCVEEILLALLDEMPTENKNIYSNYFALLSHLVHSYNEKAPVEKDPFLINLAN